MMTLLLIGIAVGITLMIGLIIKYIKTPKFDYVKIDFHCKNCGDVTNGLKCPKCEQSKVFKKF